MRSGWLRRLALIAVVVFAGRAWAQDTYPLNLDATVRDGFEHFLQLGLRRRDAAV